LPCFIFVFQRFFLFPDNFHLFPVDFSIVAQIIYPRFIIEPFLFIHTKRHRT
jgi:hypothetical protein